jgi:energy-coupling factor transport system substrate-specific component
MRIGRGEPDRVRHPRRRAHDRKHRGFVGNFFLGLVPYKIWHRVFKEEPHCRTPSSLLKFEFVTLTHAGVVALIIPLWTELVGFVPFTPLAFIIFFNELISAGIISPIEVRTVPARHRSFKKEDD